MSNVFVINSTRLSGSLIRQNAGERSYKGFTPVSRLIRSSKLTKEFKCQASTEGKRPDPLGSESELPSRDGGGGNGSEGGGGKGGGNSGGGSGDSSRDDSGKNGVPQLIAYLYAMLIAIGGIIGYKKKGSKASLQASSILAVLLVISGSLLTRGFALAMLGSSLAIGVNVALGWYMLKGYKATQKPFPQGVLSVLSGVNVLVFTKELVRQYFIWTRLT